MKGKTFKLTFESGAISEYSDSINTLLEIAKRKSFLCPSKIMKLTPERYVTIGYFKKREK